MADKINAAGYETKPWWPYVRELMKGGGSVTVEQLNVTENGTYTAEAGKAYSPVVVNVPTGIEGFSNGTITVELPETVEQFEVQGLPYVTSEGVPTQTFNSIPYDSVTESFVTSPGLNFDPDHLTIDFMFMKDAAFFMPMTVGVDFRLTGNAEKITFTDQGQNITIIKATGDFTIQVSVII